MFAPSRLLSRTAGSALARSSHLLPSTRASSSTPPSDPSSSTDAVPSPSASESTNPPTSPSGYYVSGPAREAVVPIGWSRTDATQYPSTPHRTILTDPTDLNLAHHLLPSTPHSPATLLQSQPEKYLIAKLHTQNLLLHPTDIITVPLLSRNKPALGSQLNLTRVFEVGSRDFTLKAPYGKRLAQVRCALTVLEHTQSPMQVLLKKKRRKGYQKEIRNKHQWTRLRVGDIEVIGEGGECVEDEKVQERRLSREPGASTQDDYEVTSMNMEARLAVNYGIVREKGTEQPPPRPVD